LKRAICTTLTNLRRHPSQRPSARTQPAAERECIALRDMADCILDAYDSITRRAHEKFIERDGESGREIEDWLTSEREILMAFPVNIDESADCVYAMASIPDPNGVQLAVGIESRWLVILANRRTEDAAAASARRSRKLAALSASFRPGNPRNSAMGIDEFRKRVSLSLPDSTAKSLLEPRTVSVTAPFETRRPPEMACILQLAVEVDRERSIAVLSNGLLAIRMPKAISRP
jgi:HSP20 family molecular chaperone IbpA